MTNISDEEWEQLMTELLHQDDLPTDFALSYEISGPGLDPDQAGVLQSTTTNPDERTCALTTESPPLTTESGWVQEPRSMPCGTSERPTGDIHLLVEQLQNE